MTAFGRTWIVVLDDSRARFFVRDASGRLTEAAAELHSTLGAQATLKPDERRREREKFVLGIIRILETACDGGACDRIMLVGPERMLGVMRKSASDKIRARLWREMASEFTASPHAELAQRLAPHFK